MWTVLEVMGGVQSGNQERPDEQGVGGVPWCQAEAARLPCVPRSRSWLHPTRCLSQPVSAGRR